MDLDYKKLFNFYCSTDELSNYETYELYYLIFKPIPIIIFIDSCSPNLKVYEHGKTIYPNLKKCWKMRHSSTEDLPTELIMIPFFAS